MSADYSPPIDENYGVIEWCRKIHDGVPVLIKEKYGCARTIDSVNIVARDQQGNFILFVNGIKFGVFPSGNYSVEKVQK